MGRWRGGAGLVALLAVVLGGAGVAAAVPGSPLRIEAPAALATANLGDGVALAEQTTTTAATSVRVAPPTTPTTALTATTRLTPTTRVAAVPTTARIAPPSQVGFTTTTVAPGQPPQTVPRPVNPPAWTFEEQGLSVRVKMTPIAPRLGDAVQFTIESWTDVPGVMCCNVSLAFSGRTVFRRWQEIPGPCPERPPREDQVSYRITEPTSSPLPQPDVTVLFLLRVVSSFNPCGGVQEASRSIDVGVPVVIRMPGF